MKITVKIIKENKDGSANAQVDFDKDGLETLVQWGLVAMLTKAVDEYKVRPDEAEVSIQPKSKRTVAKKKSLAKKKRKEEDLDGRC
jgi:hypothetical protein